jgi:methionine-rich copper-binding protein CopC
MKVIFQAFVMLFIAAGAHAHTQLTSSMPADEDLLDAAPDAIVLRFSEPVRLTSLALESAAAARHELGPLPSSPSDEFSVDAPALADGRYVVSWRAISADTHVVTGRFGFTVQGARPVGVSP